MGTVIVVLLLAAALWGVIYLANQKPTTIVANVAAYQQAKKQSLNASVVDAYQVANLLRIVLDSSRIINDTKNYDVKVSRIKVLNDTLGKLNAMNTTLLVKDEHWADLITNIQDLYIRGVSLSCDYDKYITQLKNNREAGYCPYCNAKSYDPDSRAVKCQACGNKAHRLKAAKQYLMLTSEEYAVATDYRNQVLGLSSNDSVNYITVQPAVAAILDSMANKLQNHS